VEKYRNPRATERESICNFFGCDLEGLESGEYTVACLAFKHLNEGRENRKYHM
jgi:hypothetical protein